MKRWFIIPVALLSLLPAQAMADRMSYSYIQLTDLVVTELADADGHDFGAKAGWIMGPYVFTDIRYEDLKYHLDAPKLTLNGHEGSVRLGYRQRLLFAEDDPQRLDWYGMVSYEDLDIDHVIDDTGFGLNLGMRWSPVHWFEYAGEVGYLDYGRPSAWAFTSDIHFNVSRFFAFVLEARREKFTRPSNFNLDRHTYSVGLRFMFGGG